MSAFLKRVGGRVGRIGRAIAVGAVVLIAGGSAAWLASGKTTASATKSEKHESDAAPKLRRTGSDTVVVPAEVQTSLGIKTAPAAIPTRKRTLSAFQGRLNYDNALLVRVQSPFAGPVTEVRQVPDVLLSSGGAVPAGKRPIKQMDRVEEGDVLAVVWSKDLGEKKSEFVDAVSKLKTDEETLRNLEGAYANGSTTERAVREQERTVKADRIAVERAEATLRAWRIARSEIEQLRAAADQVGKADASAARTDPATWARVEIKAPRSGYVLEKNVAVGQVADTTSDLFRIGELSTLAVWVNVFEEDLPLLRELKLPTEWSVSAPAAPGVAYFGRLEQIAPALDTAQNTALVTGTVENPKNELRAGMSVTVTVKLDAPKGEIEVPSEAVIEDGRASYVFVRTDPSGDTFVRCPVAVVRRSRDTISVAERPDGLKPRDLVVTSGSLLLGDAFSDLPLPKP